MNTPYLTPEQAYLAMFEFLDELYQRSKSDDVGSRLGDMSLLPDGSTTDPAVWTFWMKCVESALAGRIDAQLHLGGSKLT